MIPPLNVWSKVPGFRVIIQQQKAGKRENQKFGNYGFACTLSF